MSESRQTLVESAKDTNRIVFITGYNTQKIRRSETEEERQE